MNSSSFNAVSSLKVLYEACGAAALSADNAKLIRLGENAIYLLPKENIIVRIARTMNYWADVHNEVAVARWLASHAVPAAQTADIPQPLAIAEHPVTFWHFIPGKEATQEDIAVLGIVLRQLHSTPPPTDFALPMENIFGRVAGRVETAAGSTKDKDFLLARLAQLTNEVAQLDFPLPQAPTYGDADIGNLIIHNNKPILIDFERFAWGHPEWDLALTATEYQSAGWFTKEEYLAFAKAYGYDITTWKEGFATLQAVHELKMTTWLMQDVDKSPEMAAEYRTRMRTLRGERSIAWRPF